jgi:L-2-hydroxyglutarate oxidase
MTPSADVVVVGGGIVGLATALALSRRCRVAVLEAEPRLAAHQTGHNSGVIHSGLYYRPGSAKARLCAAGRDRLYAFCGEHGIPHERCGKLVVATDPKELSALDELERRGRANGLDGIRRLDSVGIRDREPHVRGPAGLLVPHTGIVDYPAVAGKLAELVAINGGTVTTAARVTGVVRRPDGLTVVSAAGEVTCRGLVNCGGLQCDRLARLCGVEPGVSVVPFRGEYHTLRPAAAGLIRHLVYPVPDAALPFLGVHFTRMIGGGVEAGPNAVPAFRREGYRWADWSARDMWELAHTPGVGTLARRFWRTGLGEVHRSLSRRAFWLALRRLVPALRFHDLAPGGAGVRAQALDPDGKLVDDFRFAVGERSVHVLNAPSPAATAALAIGDVIAEKAAAAFGLTTAAAGP